MTPQPEPVPQAQKPPRPIFIIKRKKVVHGGHHGGAWKVAYADFVTAMMALFIVLWLMSADEKVKEAISAFFNNPHSSLVHRPAPLRRARAMLCNCRKKTWPNCARRWSRR